MKAATAQHEVFAELVAISIHAAREGGDETGGGFVAIELLFQSTPPVKAATEFITIRRGKVEISIHAAREGGDRFRKEAERENIISIHAAREGGDLQMVMTLGRLMISIHAAREGGDDDMQTRQSAYRHFNPRRP